MLLTSVSLKGGQYSHFKILECFYLKLSQIFFFVNLGVSKLLPTVSYLTSLDKYSICSIMITTSLLIYRKLIFSFLNKSINRARIIFKPLKKRLYSERLGLFWEIFYHTRWTKLHFVLFSQ